MKSFLICPVRGVAADTYAEIVARLEQEGYQVHWPPRDTHQVDPTGLRICHDNRRAIMAADIVHVVWDGKSQGCLFDLGMTFAMRKPVRMILLPPATDGKSFQNMARAWEQSTSAEPDARLDPRAP